MWCLGLLRHDRDAQIVMNQLSMTSQFLSVVSRNPEIVSFGVVGVNVTKTLDGAPSSKAGVHSHLDVKKLNLEKLVRKRSYSVMDESICLPSWNLSYQDLLTLWI